MNAIAVVIPLYNHERYIRGAIESVLAQSRPPKRIIVVDDGSTDGSLAAARAIGDPRIEIVAQDNCGAHEALNRAIALGDDCPYIAILNSDDAYIAQRCEQCAGLLDRDPSAQLVCTRLDLMDSHGGPLPADHPRSRWFRAAWSCQDAGLSLIEWLAHANFPATTSNFFGRTEWFQAHPFRAYRYAHDYFHLLEAAFAGVLRIIPEPLVRYRIHESNTITTEPRLLIREMLRVHADIQLEQARHLTSDPALLDNLAAYRRAVWANVSAIRADAFSWVELHALRNADPARLSEWLDEAGALPRCGEFPNRRLVTAHDGMGSLSNAAGLSDRHDALRQEMKSLRETNSRLEKQLAEARRRLGSKTVAFKRLLGLRMPPF